MNITNKRVSCQRFPARSLKCVNYEKLFNYLLTHGIKLELIYHLKTWSGNFPGGPVVKNPPSNAGDEGLSPGQGTKIPHALGQISQRAATTESTHSRAHVPQLLSPCAATKDPACHNEDPTARKTQCSQINK